MKLRRWVRWEDEKKNPVGWLKERVSRTDVIIGLMIGNTLSLILNLQYSIIETLQNIEGIIPGHYLDDYSLSAHGLIIDISIPENCNDIGAFVSELVAGINHLGQPLDIDVVNDIRRHWNLPPIYTAPSLKSLCIKYVQTQYPAFFSKTYTLLPSELKYEIGLPCSEFILLSKNEKIDLAQLPYKTIAAYIKAFFNQIIGNPCLDSYSLGDDNCAGDRSIHYDITDPVFVDPVIKILDDHNILYTLKKMPLYFFNIKETSRLSIPTADNNADKLILALKNELDSTGSSPALYKK
jgi:hypothetical protein